VAVYLSRVKQERGLSSLSNSLFSLNPNGAALQL